MSAARSRLELLASRGRNARLESLALRKRNARHRFPAVVVLGAALLLPAAAVQAQRAEPTARERSEAADAYDRGVSAFLSENYAAAAHWFETANRLAPSAAALMQAIRANDRAGNEMRSASLALRLSDDYPEEEQAIRATRQILADAQSRYFLVVVNCNEECAIEVNGALEEHNRFFVEPGRRVTVTAEFPGGRLTEEVGGEAGASDEVSFTAPPPPPDQPEPARGGGGGGAAEDDGGLSPGLFWTGVAATGAAGAGLVVAGSMARAGVDEYEADPTPERLEAGQRKERWTNALIGVTGGFAAATAVIAIFTDFGGDDEGEDSQAIAPMVSPTPGGIVIGAEGRF